MIKRLRVKFVCINMALVMTMLVIILGLLYHFTAVDLERESLSALKSAVEGPGRPGRPGFGPGQLIFVLCEEPDGTILVRGGELFDLSDEKMLSDIYMQARNGQEQSGFLEQYNLRYYRDDGPKGDQYAFMDISAELSTLNGLLTTCVLIALGGFVAFLLISVLLSRWAIRPVEKAWQQQRQFVADASHELKTPLTVILTNAEMLQSSEHTMEEKGQFAVSILEVSRQMRSLVESLLQLARADRGQQKTEMKRLELSKLVERAVLPFEPVYFERGIMLESSIEPDIFVQGDETTLCQTVNILLDNGQKYAQGEVARLTLTRQGKKAVLRFFTPGTPLTQQQCSDIFKRFYRVDEARTGGVSYGLGLSIAENIVLSHGGRIWAEPAEGGNIFCVTLPEG